MYLMFTGQRDKKFTFRKELLMSIVYALKYHEYKVLNMHLKHLKRLVDNVSIQFHNFKIEIHTFLHLSQFILFIGHVFNTHFNGHNIYELPTNND